MPDEPINKNLINSIKIYYENIISSMPCYVYWKDRNYTYVGCNNLTATLLNLSSRHEIVGKTDYDFGWDKHMVDSYRLVDEEIIYKKKSILNLEQTVLLGDKTLHLLVHKTPLFDENDEVTGILGISVDITERKKMEKELSIAKTAAEIANLAKTEFLANISHDIRTPLSGIVGMAEILENEVSSPTHKKHAQDLRQSGHELLNMLNEILDVIQAGELTSSDLHATPFSLHHLIQSILNLEHPSTIIKEIELRATLDPKIPAILICDHKKLYHILLNLVGNAIKFTQAGSVEIKITLVKQQQNNVSLLFEVIDTGIGISSDALEQIFERFFRIEPAYKTQDNSRGLGLHFVQSYVKLLGGEIKVESELGKGSTFHFTISMPIETDKKILEDLMLKSKEKLPQTIVESQSNVSDIPANALHVLIIEDNQIALNVVDLMLKQAKFITTSVTSGEVALELATTQHFDFIFSDVGLPGISGIEFTQQLRDYEKLHGKPPVPIVGLTAHAEGKMHEACLAAGMNDIMLKPLNLPIIKAMIAKYTSHMG